MSALLYVNPLLGIMDPRLMLAGRFVNDDLMPDVDRPIVNVKWDNFDFIPKNTNAHDGALELVRLMLLYPGTPADPTDIVCHSGGSQVANKAIREIEHLLALLGGGTIDWSGYRFWLCGDPETCFTGASYLYPEACPPVYPGNTSHYPGCPTPPEFHGGYGIGFGLPFPCPVEVNVIIHQYDGWAMAPVDPDNSEMRRAQGISLFGILFGSRVWDFTLGCITKQVPHAGRTYYGLDIDAGTDGGVFTYTDPLRPSVKHWYVRNYPVPSLAKVRLKWLARDLDIKRRPVMDQAYGPYNAGSRRGLPVTIPAPDYDDTLSWFSL